MRSFYIHYPALSILCVLKPNNEREVVALYKMRKGGDDVGFIVFLVEFILKDNMTCFRAKLTIVVILT